MKASLLLQDKPVKVSKAFAKVWMKKRKCNRDTGRDVCINTPDASIWQEKRTLNGQLTAGCQERVKRNLLLRCFHLTDRLPLPLPLSFSSHPHGHRGIVCAVHLEVSLFLLQTWLWLHLTLPLLSMPVLAIYPSPPPSTVHIAAADTCLLCVSHLEHLTTASLSLLSTDVPLFLCHESVRKVSFPLALWSYQHNRQIGETERKCDGKNAREDLGSRETFSLFSFHPQHWYTFPRKLHLQLSPYISQFATSSSLYVICPNWCLFLSLCPISFILPLSLLSPFSVSPAERLFQWQRSKGKLSLSLSRLLLLLSLFYFTFFLFLCDCDLCRGCHQSILQCGRIVSRAKAASCKGYTAHTREKRKRRETQERRQQ